MLSVEEQAIRERWATYIGYDWVRKDLDTLFASLEAERARSLEMEKSFQDWRNEARAQAAKVARLETRLGELMERLGHAEAEEAKVARLREALRHHGTHALSCPAFEDEFAAAFRGERGNDHACTCGLSAALFEC